MGLYRVRLISNTNWNVWVYLEKVTLNKSKGDRKWLTLKVYY